MADLSTLDPRELIKESFNIEGITLSQCRTIFMDWALGGDFASAKEHITQLLAHYGPLHPDHPMTAVLREGVDGTQGKADGKRRTGRRPRG